VTYFVNIFGDLRQKKGVGFCGRVRLETMCVRSRSVLDYVKSFYPRT
jgi:hypothetical protein